MSDWTDNRDSTNFSVPEDGVLCDGPRECMVAVGVDGPAAALDNVAGGLGAAVVGGAGLLALAAAVPDGPATVREAGFDCLGLAAIAGTVGLV